MMVDFSEVRMSTFTSTDKFPALLANFLIWILTFNTLPAV